MASKKVLGLTVKIGASHTELDKALQDIQKESKKLNDDLRTVNQQLKFDPSNADLQAKKMDILSKSVQNSEKEVSTYYKAQRNINQALAEGKITASEAQDELDKYSDRISEAGNQSKRTTAELNSMRSSTKNVGTEMETAGKSALKMGDLIKANLISSAITTGLKAVGTAIKGIASALWDAAKGAASFAFNLGKTSIESAANLRETLGTSRRIFGDDMVNDWLDPWAKNGYKTMGLSETDAMNLVNQAGNLLVNKGLSQGDAAGWARALVQRSADIGANYNMSTEDAMNYILTMLKGTYSTADSIGIVTNASAVTARALQNKLEGVDTDQIIGYGAALKEQEQAQEKLNNAIRWWGKDSKQALDANEKLEKSTEKLEKLVKNYAGEITEADKALAAMQITMEQTAMTEGTFAEEATGWGGLKKVIGAYSENLKNEIGNALLPAAEAVLGKFTDYFTSDDGKELVNAISKSLSTAGDEIVKWIDGGGLSELEAKIKEKVEGITAWLADAENQQKIADFFNVTLPKACKVAETAIDVLQKTFEAAKAVIDAIGTAIDKVVEAIKAADEFIHAHANGGEGEYSWGDSATEAETALVRQTEFQYGDGWGNYDFSALDESVEDVKEKGKELVKETEKVGKDEEKAMKDGVDGTKKAASEFANVDLSDTDAILAKLRAFVGELQSLASAAGSIEIGAPSVTSSALKAVDSSLAQSVISKAAAVGSAQSLTSKVKSAFFHATGGVELTGVPHIVGESGPELFIPSVNGRVLDHMATREIMQNTVNNNNGGNITLYQTVNVSGGNANAGQKVAGDFIHALEKKGINPTRI